MGMRGFFSSLALGAGLAAGGAQALPVVDGYTAVKLTSADVLSLADVVVAPLGTASISPGSNGIPVAYFPITGGDIDTDTLAGTIEHSGSGLSLSRDGTTVELTNFVINTTTGFLLGDVTVSGTTLDDVSLFSIGLTGSPVYPFSLSLTADAAGALTTYLGLPDLTGAEIGIASTTPVTTAVPEASTVALMLGGLCLVGVAARRRSSSRREPALA